MIDVPWGMEPLRGYGLTVLSRQCSGSELPNKATKSVIDSMF